MVAKMFHFTGLSDELITDSVVPFPGKDHVLLS